MGGQVRIKGATSDGKILLDANVSRIYHNGIVTLLQRNAEDFTTGEAVSSFGTAFGGSAFDTTFQLTAQLWDSEGQIIPTSFNSSDLTFQAITRLQETPDGFIGVALTTNTDGEEADTLISLTSTGSGYLITPVSSQYTSYSVQGLELIGDTGFYVTHDDAVPNDASLRMIGSSDTIAIADLLPSQPPAISFSGSTLRWTDIAASQYRLWVNDENSLKVIDHTGAETSFDVSLPFGSYTAWVKPDSAAWTTPYRFSIYHDAIAVDPLTTLDATPVVSWAGPADGNYLVWVSLKGQSAAVYTQNVTGNSVELPALARGVYTVWVRQHFADGSFSNWGTGSTLDVAQRPVLSLAGSVLSWSSYANATQYELWVSTDLTTDRITVSPTFVSGLSLNLSSLSLAAGNYRVWIRAVSNGSAGLFATSLWGSARMFTV